MKITLGQFTPLLGKKEENLEKITDILEQASKDQSDLVLLPELCLSGYFIQDIERDLAESIDGPSVKYIQKQCKKLDIYAVFPWAERGEDGKVYNSACLIANDGSVIGTYRKVHLYDTEKEVFTAGDDFKVFDTELGKIGIMICFDIDFPESARVLRLKGAEIILVATNYMAPYERYQEVYLQSRSMENEVPIAICNRTGQERELVYFGESAAYDLYGKQLIKLDGTERTNTVHIPLNETADSNLDYQKNRMAHTYNNLEK